MQGRGFPRATARKAPPLRPKKSPIFPAAFPGCNTLHLASKAVCQTFPLLELVEQLTDKQVEFVSQKEAIDTTTPTGKFMLTIFGAVAELEREYILQRQREGIAIAKEKGIYKGRKPIERSELPQVAAQWREGRITAAEAMRRLDMKPSTFYRKVKALP